VGQLETAAGQSLFGENLVSSWRGALEYKSEHFLPPRTRGLDHYQPPPTHRHTHTHTHTHTGVGKTALQSKVRCEPFSNAFIRQACCQPN
jgi:hypothetical protein